MPGEAHDGDTLLAEYAIDEATEEPDLQALAEIATHVSGAPYAVVNLIDAHFQHQVAAIGISPSVCAREDSMCAVTMVAPRPRVEPVNSETIAPIMAALADIRASGYCLSRDEMTDGASSVAAPVLGPGGAVVAGLSVVVSSSTGNLQPLVPAVRLTASSVSRALGAPVRRPAASALH